MATRGSWLYELPVCAVTNSGVIARARRAIFPVPFVLSRHAGRGSPIPPVSSAQHCQTQNHVAFNRFFLASSMGLQEYLRAIVYRFYFFSVPLA